MKVSHLTLIIIAAFVWFCCRLQETKQEGIGLIDGGFLTEAMGP